MYSYMRRNPPQVISVKTLPFPEILQIAETEDGSRCPGNRPRIMRPEKVPQIGLSHKIFHFDSNNLFSAMRKLYVKVSTPYRVRKSK